MGRLFDVVVAEDVLPRVLHRVGPVPGVIGTRDLTGPWDTPGSQRTVQLQDGATVREQLTRFERPAHFEYRVDRFTGPFARLVDHASGVWHFSATADGSAFTWTYRFQARSRLATPVLGLITATVWARYMERCADACTQLAEGATTG